MSALGPYVLIVAGVLVVMVAGLLIAGLTHQANQEEDCQEWVASTDPMGMTAWTPCPHRRPCPLHDKDNHRHA